MRLNIEEKQNDSYTSQKLMVNLAVDKYHNLISHAYWPHPTTGGKQKFDQFGRGGGGKNYYLEVHETFRACPLFEFQIHSWLSKVLLQPRAKKCRKTCTMIDSLDSF